MKSEVITRLVLYGEPVLSHTVGLDMGKYMPYHMLLQCKAGATTQSSMTTATPTLRMAQVGTIRGLPKYPVSWFQSNGMGTKSSPVNAPNM